MSLHKEVSFETEICEHLRDHGWLYAEGDAAGYDRARALFPADVLAWVQETQPKAWETLTKNHGAQAGDTLLARLRDQLDQRGTLDVLRHGVELLGLKQPLRLAEFKPALGINADILARYAANRLRLVRQVRYSLHNENSFDLVLFLNGVPVATAELKTDFTQSIGDAIDQYRFDGLPRPKGQAPEPLLSFPNGALVHFAVSNREVAMVTKLDGPATVFLPFNQGDNGAAGNPVNPLGGHRTAYLWEQVWARESWLEILGRYLIAQRDKKKLIKQIIFPRFHQLDVTRKLQRAVLVDGIGGKYLVQHSAGSGKTNSIAWTAHFLADLHDAQDKKVFDTVLVVSDRNVIDSQLQEALFDFPRQSELVAAIAPVEDRLMKRYKAAQAALKAAKEKGDEAATKTAQDELNALILFKGDMGAFIRLYTFLSQIFDYGNTAIEKRAIFYKRLLPLLEFGREREGIDLSKVVLTHHNLKNLGKRAMPLGEGETPKLEPITEAGSGSVQEKERAYPGAIIEKVNDLFDGELTEQDKLVYVNNVIRGKLLESTKLQQQAANNSKEQFANSPDLNAELMNAIMGALDAHTLMSTQALNSPAVQRGMKDILLNHARLWETLRGQAAE